MSEVLITYENLYEVLRREKYRTELQKLDLTFYQDVIRYLNEKEAILASQSKKDSIFASKELEKTQIQLKNVRKILKELYEKRESKIIQAALFASRSNMAQDTSMMLQEELSFYTELNKTFSTYKGNNKSHKKYNTKICEKYQRFHAYTSFVFIWIFEVY